jgi:nucleoside-diphosphate-sugar epimerase
MRVFVTGASGWIGSALIPELTNAGHEVVGLARSDPSASGLAAAGVTVQRGDLDDLDLLRRTAAESDGVVHLAFNHEWMRNGDFEGAASSDRRAVEALGDALAGSGRPLVIASGAAGITRGEVATEQDGHGEPPAALPAPLRIRRSTAEYVLSLASRDVRGSIIRLAPTVHGAGDRGFMATLVRIARNAGVSGYIGDGSNRWPAIHRLDAARLFRLALENAPAGSTLHGVAEEGIALKDIAETIGRHLGVPVASVPSDNSEEHFGPLAGLIGTDSPVSSAHTRALLGWQPTHAGLIDDLDQGHYFKTTTA